MMRRAGVAARPARRPARRNAPAGQRRNGLPALTWITTSGSRAVTPARASRSATAAAAARVGRHLHRRRVAGSGGAMPSAASRSHWFIDRVARPQLARPRDARACTSSCGRRLVADAHRRAAQPGEQRRARPAMKIDGEVEALARAAGGRAPGRRAARAGRGARGATITSSRCGLPATTGAAAGSTR